MSEPKPIQPTPTSLAARASADPISQAAQLLRDARNQLDYAATLDHLPERLAGYLTAIDDQIGQTAQSLQRLAESLETRADLYYSEHSPIYRNEKS